MLIPEGHLAQHMAVHIGEMNLVAPVCAAMFLRFRTVPENTYLAPAAVLQIILLWGWHTPSIFLAASGNHALMAAMHLSLFGAALWFWTAVIAHVRSASWKPIATLLITGKLFCLLGVLLTFAPRALYAPDESGAGGMAAAMLADQQLAGLLMLAACPVVYVGAAIVVARRWLAALNRAQAWDFREGSA